MSGAAGAQDPLVGLVEQLFTIGNAVDLDADQVRDLLEGIGRDFPFEAHTIASTVMRCALTLIAAGTDDPQSLAEVALIVTERWWSV